MNKERLAFLVVCLIAGAGGLWFYFGDDSVIVGERPEEMFSATGAMRAKESTISVALVFPFDEIASRLEQKINKKYKGSGKKECKKLLVAKTCWRPSWDLNLSARNINVKKLDAENFSIRALIDVSGEISTGARVGNHMPFHASMDWVLDSRFSMKEDGCPEFDAEIDYHWVKKPKVRYRIIKGVDVTIRIADFTDDKIREMIGQFKKRVEESLGCDAIRSKLLEASAKKTPLLAHMGAGSRLYLSHEVVAAGFSGYHVDEDRVSLALQVRLNLAVSPDAGMSGMVQGNEMVFKRIEPDEGSINLHMAVEIPYGIIEELLKKETAGKYLDFGSGFAKILVQDVEVYPSGEYIALGLKVSIKGIAGLIANNALVYMRVQPLMDENGKKITPSSPELISVSNNPVVDLIGLRGLVDEALQKSKRDIDQILQQKIAKSASEMDNVEFDWVHKEASVSDIALAENGLRFVFNLVGNNRIRYESGQ